MRKNLVLLGMMGVGKTTLGKIVAKELSLNFIDTDKLIEKENSMKIKDIFEKKGEIFFRSEEEKITLKCLSEKDSIIALGGGSFMNKKIRDKVLSYNCSIWLDLNLKNLNYRLKKNSKRPLLKKNSSFKLVQDIYYSRRNEYKKADHKLDCNKLAIKQLVKKILNIYASN